MLTGQWKSKVFNNDCIDGMKTLPSNSIDLVFTDPPYGINGSELDAHYNRDESFVVPGYIDVDKEKYEQFSKDWISECARLIKPSGSMYIVSGYTNLRHVLNALDSTDLVEVNHIIAKYTFPVYTKNKWVSSHYHVLYYVKPPISKKTFNTSCRFVDSKQSYHDRMSVQDMPRSHKPGQVKNKNQLSEQFIEKFILYSSAVGDIVLDPFGGSFSTGRVALKNGRRFVGFELNSHAFNEFSTGVVDLESEYEVMPEDTNWSELSYE